MNRIFYLAFTAALLFLPEECWSQKLSVGGYSGINFADIHGNRSPGKWDFSPGPVQGISLDFPLTGVISFNTGIGFSSVYYEYSPYYYKPHLPGYYPAGYTDLYYYSLSSLYVMPPYYAGKDKMSFSFMQLPFRLKLTIPSSPSLSLSAGAYYSFLTDHSLEFITSDEPSGNDFGFTFSAGLSYPVTEKLTAMLNSGYYAGKRRFLEHSGFRHGSFDLSIGLSYSPGLRDKEPGFEGDTTSYAVSFKLIYRAGINISGNNVKAGGSKYGYKTGISFGFLADIGWGTNASFRTGIAYEKTGYSVSDSSDYFYRYGGEGPMAWDVSTTVSTDYLSIPALFNLNVGRRERIFVFAGPYIAFRLNSICTGKAYNRQQQDTWFSVSKTVVYDDIERVIKPFDAGYVAGAGVSLPLLEGYFLEAVIQYRHGWREVFDKAEAGEPARPLTQGEIIKNETLSFQAGLKVPVMRRSHK